MAVAGEEAEVEEGDKETNLKGLGKNRDDEGVDGFWAAVRVLLMLGRLNGSEVVSAAAAAAVVVVDDIAAGAGAGSKLAGVKTSFSSSRPRDWKLKLAKDILLSESRVGGGD